MVESLDTVPNCVKEKMHKIAQEKGGSFTKKEQKTALGKSFGMCRGDFSEDVLKILDDLSVKSHFRSGKYVTQHQRKLDESQASLGNILSFAIYKIEKKIKGLEKELAKAFKAKKQGEYNKILEAINIRKGDIEKVKGALRKRGIIDMSMDKLRIAINKLETEMKEKGITDSEERETYYRMRFMSEMSTGTVKSKQDYLREKLTRLEKVLKNVNPRDRKIIVEEIAKIKKNIKARTYYRNYSKGVKYDDLIKTEEQDLQAALGKIRKKIMDFEMVRMRSDASIFKQGIAKAKENKQRSIFFRQYRPLETLNEVTKTSGKSTSANIAGMEYSEGMLKVTFNWEGKGEVEYGYDVGPDFYDRMAKSQSKGKFLWKELRGKSPGYVIDNPRKMTPGGVGGSIVPYTKITKRAIQGGEFRKLQKHYAKQLRGKIKVVANMPFVRQKQKLISRHRKGFGSKPVAQDFYWFKITDLSDDVRWCVPIMSLIQDSIPVKGHSRGGKWVAAYDRKGDKAEELKKKIKGKSLERTPIPRGGTGTESSKIEETFKKWQAERRGEKVEEKAPAKRRGLSDEEKRRKEIDKQARATKATPPPEPREEAIQKLIEETGMERKQAEERIAKLMGVTPKQAEKKSEVKGHEIKFKAQNKQMGEKLIALNQINAKLDSIPLKNIIMLFQKAFILIATKRDPEAILRSFAGYYKSLRSDKKMVIKEKDELITQIGKLHKELIALSKKKESEKDFSVKAHFRKGKMVQQHEKQDKKKQKHYGKVEYKHLKGRIKELDKTLKSLKKKADAGDKEAEKNYYILLKYQNKLSDDKWKAEGKKLFGDMSLEDFEYISAAVDQCAKRAIAKQGGKGNYSSEVANCIRLIGISRRQAGLSPRPQGTQREQRRGARRARVPARRERTEARVREIRVRQSVQRAEQILAREERVRITAGFIRNIGEVANYIAIGNYQSATQVLRDQFDKMHQISNDELRADIEQRLQQAAITLARRIDESNAAVLRQIRTHANTFRHYIEGGTLEDARRELSNANSDANRIFGDIDAQRRANALVFEMQQKFDERSEREAGEARIRELNRVRLERQQEAANELRAFEEEQAQRVVMSPEVQAARAEARRLRQSGTIQGRMRRARSNAESSVSGLNEPEGGSVIHIPISESSSREQYEYELGVFRALPEGMEVERVGFMRRYSVSSRHYGERYWVHPRLISIGSAPVRIATRLGRIASQRPASTVRERSEPAIARRHARREGYKREIKRLVEGGMSKSEARKQVIPPKVKWKVKSRGVYANGDSVKIRNFKPEKWTSGSTLTIRIKHPDGREAGYASMSYANVHDPNTGQRRKGIYLGRLFFETWASGETQGQRRQYRNAPIKDLMAKIFKLADQNRLWISGGATPIGVVHGSAAAQRLFNFYESAGGIPYSESERASGTSAGFYRPPRGRWAQSADFVMNIRIKNPMNIFQYTDGHIYYYDEEDNMIYRMEFNRAKIIKNKLRSGKK